MIIFESDFLTTEYFEDEKIFVNTWTGKEMRNEDFQYCMTEVGNLTFKHLPKGIVVNTKKFNFTIEPELQEWYDGNIVPMHKQAGIKFMAFVVSEEMISQLSIEQTMDEAKAKSLSTRYFDSVEEGREWMKTKE